MASTKNKIETNLFILMLIGLSTVASTNIDCNGRSFRCVNSTHFMICVDLGGGLTLTVDDFMIPCPPSTTCQTTNRFECEFQSRTTPAPTGRMTFTIAEPTTVSLPIKQASKTTVFLTEKTSNIANTIENPDSQTLPSNNVSTIVITSNDIDEIDTAIIQNKTIITDTSTRNMTVTPKSAYIDEESVVLDSDIANTETSLLKETTTQSFIEKHGIESFTATRVDNNTLEQTYSTTDIFSHAIETQSVEANTININMPIYKGSNLTESDTYTLIHDTETKNWKMNNKFNVNYTTPSLNFTTTQITTATPHKNNKTEYSIGATNDTEADIISVEPENNSSTESLNTEHTTTTRKEFDSHVPEHLGSETTNEPVSAILPDYLDETNDNLQINTIENLNTDDFISPTTTQTLATEEQIMSDLLYAPEIVTSQNYEIMNTEFVSNAPKELFSEIAGVANSFPFNSDFKHMTTTASTIQVSYHKFPIKTSTKMYEISNQTTVKSNDSENTLQSDINTNENSYQNLSMIINDIKKDLPRSEASPNQETRFTISSITKPNNKILPSTITPVYFGITETNFEELTNTEQDNLSTPELKNNFESTTTIKSDQGSNDLNYTEFLEYVSPEKTNERIATSDSSNNDLELGGSKTTIEITNSGESITETSPYLNIQTTAQDEFYLTESNTLLTLPTFMKNIAENTKLSIDVSGVTEVTVPQSPTPTFITNLSTSQEISPTTDINRMFDNIENESRQEINKNETSSSSTLDIPIQSFTQSYTQIDDSVTAKRNLGTLNSLIENITKSTISSTASTTTKKENTFSSTSKWPLDLTTEMQKNHLSGAQIEVDPNEFVTHVVGNSLYTTNALNTQDSVKTQSNTTPITTTVHTGYSPSLTTFPDSVIETFTPTESTLKNEIHTDKDDLLNTYKKDKQDTNNTVLGAFDSLFNITTTAPLITDNTYQGNNENITLRTAPNLTFVDTNLAPKIQVTESSMSMSPSSTNKIPNEQLNFPVEKSGFDCGHQKRGKYGDNHDCKKFYFCLGHIQPVVGHCPNNTVFSEIKTQCTKNLSHCIRNNQFQCSSEGRFVDLNKDNIYYICVRNKQSSFVRFKLQCQNSYHLNKTLIKCIENNEESSSLSTSFSSASSKDSVSSSEGSLSNNVNKKKKQNFECEQEGKFPDPYDCKKYYTCTLMSSEYQKQSKKCNDDETFHKKEKNCVDAGSHEC